MRGSITVEAALLCPFLCLIVCAMVLVTLFLYDIVEDYGKEAVKAIYELPVNSEVLRMERIMCGEGED